jgi:hypothetical protein
MLLSFKVKFVILIIFLWSNIQIMLMYVVTKYTSMFIGCLICKLYQSVSSSFQDCHLLETEATSVRLEIRL